MKDTSRSLRLAVLYTVPFQSFAEELAEEVVGAIRQQAPGVEIAHHDVSRKRIYVCPGCKPAQSRIPCRVNDNESNHYKPDDEFIALLDSITNSDILLLVGTIRAGGLNATAQNLLERLECANGRAAHGEVLHDIAAGVVLASHSPNTWAVADHVIGVLNCFGATIPPHGSVTVTSAGAAGEDEGTDSVSSTDDVTRKAARDALGDKDTMESINLLARGLVAAAKG